MNIRILILLWIVSICCSSNPKEHEVDIECRFMFYSCDPCSQYKVKKVNRGNNELLDKDVFLILEKEEIKDIIESNIMGSNYNIRVFGKTTYKLKKESIGTNGSIEIKVDSVVVAK